MAKEAGKPEGWRKFDSLAKRLAGVPKEQVDAKVAADKKKRLKTKRKKK